MYKTHQSVTVSNPIRQEEKNTMNMTEISIAIINEDIEQTEYKLFLLNSAINYYYFW